MKKSYLYVFAWGLLYLVPTAYSQNTLTIPNVSGGARDTVNVSIEIDNADAFIAFQLSLKLHAQLTYLSGSAALTARASDHTISARIVSGDSLRIVAYSSNRTPFSGNSGSVVTFKLVLKTVPGNYPLAPKRVVISNSNSQNILTGVTNGQVTILAPEIHISPTSLSYTRTIVGNYRDMSFSLYNNGNTTLHIDSIIASPLSAYSIMAGWSATASPSSSQSITVRFAPLVKGNIAGTAKVYSDDPDEPVLTVSLSGLGYKVNELRTSSVSTHSGADTTLSFRINNQEPFTGFQFDLILPPVMTFIPGSEQLTARANGHSVSANTITGGKLRIVSYSSSQATFNGADGDVVKVRFHVEGTGGSYGLNLSNTIITDSTEQNILSDSYNGQLNIAAGDIQSATSIQYGSVSIFDTADVNLTLQNTGNDTLHVTGLAPDAAGFWADATLPFSIAPSQQRILSTHFHSGTPGAFSGKYRMRSNDPDEDPYDVSFSAAAYSPNTMGVRDTSAVIGRSVFIPVEINNNDPFTAFQLDVVLPPPCACVLDSCRLTNRARGDHTLIKAHIGGNTYRFMAYSSSNALFIENSGSVLKIYCSISGSTGDHMVSIQNPLISDADGQNILSSFNNGTLDVNSLLLAKMKVFFEGPYQAGGKMTTNLKTSGAIPNTSPYADGRTVTTVPDSVTDWVSVELRSSATGPTVKQKSFFLKSNGAIVDTNGTATDLEIPDVAAGSYFIVVRHRNHLAVMSASAQALNAVSASLYDFTGGSGQYYGSNGTKQIATGVWGMWAGDVNQDKYVTTMDYTVWYNSARQGESGYKTTDINMDGVVTTMDYTKWYNNARLGAASGVP